MNRILISILLLFSLQGVYSQTVDFTYQSANGIYCSPSVIKFTQACSGNPTGFTWNFGNGKKGYSSTENSVYIAPGTYTVKLTATFSNSILEVSKTIVINPPVTAAITVDRDYICKPGIINFTGSGNSNIATYEWNFGDTTALVTTTVPGVDHTFANFAVDTVKLRATDVMGCYGDTSIVISIKAPPITSSVTPDRGCIPATASFSSTLNLPLNDSVINYKWDFNDGTTPEITGTNKTTHLYTTVGSHLPTLAITTNEGCRANYTLQFLAYGTPPVNTFANAKKAVICGSETAVLASGGTNAFKYYWFFGDGAVLNTSDSIVTHKYTTLGVKNIGVVISYNGCNAVNFERTSVKVIGVIAHYTSSNICPDNKAFLFTNTSEGNVSTSLWDFGDGQQQINKNATPHSYAAPGQFLSSFIANDAVTGCSDTTTRMIYITNPLLVTSDSTACKSDSVMFSIKNGYSDTSATYTWHLLGADTGPDSSTVIKVKAGAAGIFDNYVVINRGPQFCLDTIRSSRTFTVKNPSINFDAPANICFNKPVIITNTSQPGPSADSIVLSYWNYGNSAPNDSIYQPVPFQYSEPGAYNVTLTAIDQAGCQDSLTKIINVNPTPFVSIQSKDSVCVGQSVTMIALNNNENSVVWSPAAGLSCLNCDTAIATPLISSTYYATTVNSFNCGMQDSIFIYVTDRFTAPPHSGSASICINESVQLDALTKGKKILWSPATGLSNPAIYNPVATPLQTITYVATLTDSAGCFSNATDFNVIVNPLPTVDAGPDKFYVKGASFTFSPTYGNNITGYNWAPSLLLSCSDCPIPTGVAGGTEKYTVTVTSDKGCVASDSVIIHTECVSSELYMPKAFSPNNDGLNDFYYPVADGFNTILSFTIFDRNGKIVFAAHNFPPSSKSFGWNGKYKGKDQPTGNYVYTVEAICRIGQKVFVQGSVVLVR